MVWCVHVHDTIHNIATLFFIKVDKKTNFLSGRWHSKPFFRFTKVPFKWWFTAKYTYYMRSSYHFIANYFIYFSCIQWKILLLFFSSNFFIIMNSFWHNEEWANEITIMLHSNFCKSLLFTLFSSRWVEVTVRLDVKSLPWFIST